MYFDFFNAIELIWGDVKGYVARTNISRKVFGSLVFGTALSASFRLFHDISRVKSKFH